MGGTKWNELIQRESEVIKHADKTSKDKFKKQAI
jgi:hypothetical protein